MNEENLAHQENSNPTGEGDRRSDDFEHVGAIVARSPLLICSGCGERFRGRDLIEVMDWHESLTFFEGDVLCKECASGHGVI